MLVLRRNNSTSFKESCPKEVSLQTGIVLLKNKEARQGKILSKYIKTIRKEPDDFVCYSILLNGNNIGNLHLRKIDGKKAEIAWIDIESSHRGNKYATSTIEWCINYFRGMGFEEVSLEVPGKAPDAKHIYEKLGFKDTGITREKDNESWNGLTKMILKLN